LLGELHCSTKGTVNVISRLGVDDGI
jgi:hypothetical protein